MSRILFTGGVPGPGEVPGPSGGAWSGGSWSGGVSRPTTKLEIEGDLILAYNQGEIEGDLVQAHNQGGS